MGDGGYGDQRSLSNEEIPKTIMISVVNRAERLQSGRTSRRKDGRIPPLRHGAGHQPGSVPFCSLGSALPGKAVWMSSAEARPRQPENASVRSPRPASGSSAKRSQRRLPMRLTAVTTASMPSRMR